MNYFDERLGTTISSKNIFQLYENKEDMLTKALLHLFEECGLGLLGYVARELGIDIKESYYTVKTQQSLKENKNEKDGFSVIDGLITLSPLQFLIENKIVENSITENNRNNLAQLDKHRDYIDILRGHGVTAVLLYVTPDKDKPKILEELEVNWCPWIKMRSLVNNYYDENNITSPLREAFNGLYDSVFEAKNSIPKEELVAVLAGSYAEPCALEKGIYHCQPWRNFRDAKYFAFYKDKKISKVFKIIESYRSNKEITDPVLKEKTKDLTTDQIFVLEELKDFLAQPIINDKKDYNNKAVAFTMGQPRYCSLSKLKNAKKTSDLETK